MLPAPLDMVQLWGLASCPIHTGGTLDFTPTQLEAIEKHHDANLQLIACAGSGKTEVVSRRVARLLQKNKKLQPDQIVAFTFTEKAASELKERISARCRESMGEVQGLAELYVGTIHGFCLELLKTEVPRFSRFELLNEVQQSLFTNRNSRKSGLTVCTQLDGRPLRRYIDTGRYLSCLNLLREAEVESAALTDCSVAEGLVSYRELLNEKSYFDYSSLLEEAVSVVEGDPEVRRRLAARVRHVIVDEYQDVNPIQERLIRALHDLGARLCVVGDDDQTIYQWRGSDIQGILHFAKRYPKVKQLRLQENFRSSQGIVETARGVIERNGERLAKKMVATQAQRHEPGDICALAFDNPEAEAAFIVRTLKQLHGTAFQEGDASRGLAWSDFAILLRSVRTNGEPILKAIEEAGLPVVIVGMNRLFDAPEALAARELFYFLGGRDEATPARLREAWSTAELGLKPKALREAIADAERMRTAIHEGAEQRWSVYNLQRQFLSFIEHLRLSEEDIPGEGRGERIFYNLGKFSQIISDFEAIHFQSAPAKKYEEFASFLEHGAEGAYPEGWQGNAYARPDAVQVMTVHQAKGMQWPVVFLPALLKNRFPAARVGGSNVWHCIPRDAIQGSERFDSGVDDERRLFYVAMTRSQKFLFMSWAPIDGKKNRYRLPSRFFAEVCTSRFVSQEAPGFSRRKRLRARPKGGVAQVVLSFSELKYFFECPYQFKLRSLYGFNAPLHEALGYGKSLHDALAELHGRALDNKRITSALVPGLLDTHLHLPYAYPTLREKLVASAQRILEDYIQRNKARFARIEFSEKKIELSLGDGVFVSGRIDLVRRLDTDEVTIVDLKTSARSQAEAVTETQLHLYALGYEQLTGRQADFVETYELEEGRSKPRPVSATLHQTVQKNVMRAARALRGNAFPTTPSRETCATCDYLRMCADGRTQTA